MTGDYISREAILQEAHAISGPITGDGWDNFGVYALIKRQPAADVAPVVHARWAEEDLDKFRKYKVTCSRCGAWYIGNYDAYDEPCDFNFCPNCGAKMDGGDAG